MSYKKGFTLIEIIVVLVIIAILAAVAMPSYQAMINKGIAKAADNNLITLIYAEQVYYYDHGEYCYDETSAQPACASISLYCGTNLAALNCNLHLNVIDNNNAYMCLGAYDGVNGLLQNENNPECAAWRYVPEIEELVLFKSMNGRTACNLLTDAQYCPR